MKYISIIILFTIGIATMANGNQISKKECEEVWADGEIIHDFDELEVVGGNYRPRSYIRYKGAVYYGILTIQSTNGSEPNIWVSMSCWDSKTPK